MSKTITTGYIRVAPADTDTYDLTDISHLNSARIRWRGVDNEYYIHDSDSSSSATGFAAYPAVRSGWEFDYHIASLSVTVNNPWGVAYTSAPQYDFGDGGGLRTGTAVSIPPYSSHTFSISSVALYSNRVGQFVVISATTADGYLTVTSKNATAYTYIKQAATQQTVNPSVTIAGNTTQHTGTLTDGAVSSWYALSGMAKAVNNILHGAANNNVRADVEIEYTYEPYLAYTVQETPEHASSTTDTTVEYVFTLTAVVDNSATKYHARIRLDNYSTMPSPTVYESKDSQTGWSYWTGSAWAAFPSAGVDPGTQVKYTKVMPLSTVYWDTASWDGYTYGRQGTAYKVRVVISSGDKYALQIGGVAYNALSLKVVETSNGEIGGIVATLDNKDGTTFNAINFGDTLVMAVMGVNRQEDYEAVVREKSPSGSTVDITAITGDGILAERLVKEDYTAQDIGLIVADIIDTYCAPLTFSNVDTSIGFVAPVVANGKSALSVLEELRKNYGLYYYVDKDWDLHLYKSTAVSDVATIFIERGEIV